MVIRFLTFFPSNGEENLGKEAWSATKPYIRGSSRSYGYIKIVNSDRNNVGGFSRE